MNLKNVKEFIKLAKEEGVSSLKYEEKDLKISVELIGKSSVQFQSPTPQASIPTQTEAVKADVQIDKNVQVITSPFVGTFYSSASPGEPEFVTVGKKVSKGETLCILEAMKIMNEIESEFSGELVEVCVDNESLVEFGQPLFKIRV